MLVYNEDLFEKTLRNAVSTYTFIFPVYGAPHVHIPIHPDNAHVYTHRCYSEYMYYTHG